MKPWIAMRANNDMPIIARTLERLAQQTIPFELLILDNQSTDGTLEEVKKYTDNIVTITKYIPGQVINRGMENAEGEYVFFLNSDCIPQSDDCLEKLVAGFDDEGVAAVFGRQVPRPDCWPIYAKDTEDTYGDGSRHQYFRSPFSMAWSGVRRSVWESMKFDERLIIAEDIDWTYRARQAGHRVNYVADSAVEHSHNYTLKQFYGRMRKEGRDDALVFDWTSWERSFLRQTFLPLGRRVLSDWKYCLRNFHPAWLMAAPVFRVAEAVARRQGFNDGWRERQQDEVS